MFGLFNSEEQARKKNACEVLKERKSILTPLFALIFLYLKINPLGVILICAIRSCKCLKKHSVVEIYVLGFLTLEIVVFGIMSQFMPFPLWAAILITIILGIRLLDITQSWVNTFLVQPAREVLYASRLLILTLINYVELIFSFSILAYLWNNTFDPIIDSLSKSITFTLGTMTAIGSKYEPISNGAWAIYISEIGFGVFFLIIVLVRALTYFESKRQSG